MNSFLPFRASFLLKSNRRELAPVRGLPSRPHLLHTSARLHSRYRPPPPCPLSTTAAFFATRAGNKYLATCMVSRSNRAGTASKGPTSFCKCQAPAWAKYRTPTPNPTVPSPFPGKGKHGRPKGICGLALFDFRDKNRGHLQPRRLLPSPLARGIRVLVASLALVTLLRNSPPPVLTSRGLDAAVSNRTRAIQFLRPRPAICLLSLVSCANISTSLLCIRL